jgi:hypothetical protein
MFRIPRTLWAFATLFLSVLMLSPGLSAQQVFGSIYGTVTDASGGAIANATVTITDTGKGTVSKVTTNESGNYTKGQLIPGSYQIQIESAGFSKAVSSAVSVSVDQAARFDATLQPGNVTQQIEVTASAPLLQTDRADVAQTYSAHELASLPTVGRNLQSFELLSPGTSSFGWQQNRAENPQGGVMIQVNGQPFSGTGFELDGTANQDPILGEILINPTFDSTQEVKQAAQVYDAEFGYVSAGHNSYSTKSGSNAFHGSAFEYIYLNTPGFQDFGRNPFNSAENTQVPTVQWNQFGGSLGGRVIKDKLFFFADAQLTRQKQGSSVLTSVPTAAARLGDLSGYVITNSDGTQQNLIYNPMTGNQTTGIGRQLFPGNRIPQNMISPQASALLAGIPLPNTVEQGSGYDFRNNYSVAGANTFNTNQWNTRWDYYLNEKNTFFGRYSYAGFETFAPGVFGSEYGGPAFGGYGGNSNVLNQSIAGGWTHTASPTLINELRFGYMRYHVVATPNGVGTDPATQAGIPGLNTDDFYTSGMPAFFIGDRNDASSTKFGYALDVNSCNCPLTQLEQQYQVVDNLTKILGNHTFKFGADVRYALNLRVPSDKHRAGELDFAAGYTGVVDPSGGVTQGYGLATFLLGEATTFSRYVSTTTNAQERQKRSAFYAQDQWRITPKLTVNYGLRWELVFPETVNAPGNGGWVDLNTGLVNVMGVGQVPPQGLQNMNWHNFAPRLGLAYQLTRKTVVRAGTGWSYGMGTFGSTFGHAVTQNLPVLAQQTLNASQTFDGVFNLNQGPPAPSFITPDANGQFPLPNGVTPRVRPATMTLPLVMAWNATIEQQVTNKIAVAAAYVGNQGRHGLLASGPTFDENLPLFVPGAPSLNAERPYYGWRQPFGWTQSINYYCNCANNEYNSFQATFKVQNLSGYTMQGSFTYQSAKGDGYGNNGNYAFLYDRALGWGNEDYISQRQFVLSQTYDIPFGKGKRFGANVNRFVDYALGGWHISGITTYYSGLPFNPQIGTFPTGYARPNSGPSNTPDIGTGDPYAGAQGNRNQWFVGGLGSAFLLPAQNVFGNYAPNTLWGPRFINQDLSLYKTFALTERFHFTLRTDASNSFNHTNLGLPNSNVTDPFAGQITGLANGSQMRRLQFSGRIDF